jgi:hypothetical protein
MYELKRLLCSKLGLLWERCSKLLPCQTCLTQLYGRLDVGHAMYHLATPHLRKSLKVEVAKLTMPTPWNGVAPRNG